jgi:DNA-binding ferritin-like protein
MDMHIGTPTCSPTPMCSIKTHAYHWNVRSRISRRGIFCSRPNTRTSRAGDTLAERLRALGVSVPRSYSAMAKLLPIKERHGAWGDGHGALSCREALGRTLRAAFKKGEADGDQASMDMLIGRTEVTDKSGVNAMQPVEGAEGRSRALTVAASGRVTVGSRSPSDRNPLGPRCSRRAPCPAESCAAHRE